MNQLSQIRLPWRDDDVTWIKNHEGDTVAIRHGNKVTIFKRYRKCPQVRSLVKMCGWEVEE